MPLGEVVDRITILRLKATRIPGARGRAASRHLEALEGAWTDADLPALDTLPTTDRLAAVNARLWDVEDRIRALEAAGDFGADFVAAARQVVRLNDERSRWKAALDAQLGSEFVDPKSYGVVGRLQKET
jgi:hypothetical protein